MAEVMIPKRSKVVSVNTTVKQITGVLRGTDNPTSSVEALSLQEPSTDIYVVTASEATDGGALPTEGIWKVVAGDDFYMDLDGVSFVGLAAASGTGTVRVLFS